MAFTVVAAVVAVLVILAIHREKKQFGRVSGTLWKDLGFVFHARAPPGT